MLLWSAWGTPYLQGSQQSWESPRSEVWTILQQHSIAQLAVEDLWTISINKHTLRKYCNKYIYLSGLFLLATTVYR